MAFGKINLCEKCCDFLIDDNGEWKFHFAFRFSLNFCPFGRIRFIKGVVIERTGRGMKIYDMEMF